MIVEYYKKNVYGQDLFFIKEENIANNVKNLTGRKTITEKDMRIMNDTFGIEFKQVIN